MRSKIIYINSFYSKKKLVNFLESPTFCRFLGCKIVIDYVYRESILDSLSSYQLFNGLYVESVDPIIVRIDLNIEKFTELYDQEFVEFKEYRIRIIKFDDNLGIYDRLVWKMNIAKKIINKLWKKIF